MQTPLFKSVLVRQPSLAAIHPTQATLQGASVLQNPNTPPWPVCFPFLHTYVAYANAQKLGEYQMNFYQHIATEPLVTSMQCHSSALLLSPATIVATSNDHSCILLLLGNHLATAPLYRILQPTFISWMTAPLPLSLRQSSLLFST